MNLDVTFEQSPLDARLSGVEDGGVLQAQRLLPLLQSEDDALLVFEELEQRRITLDITALPVQETAGQTAVRLRREQELARKGTLLTALEENDPLRVYLEELAAIPAAGDADILAQELLSGNDRVAQQLVNLQLHRVVTLAVALIGRGVLLLDLIQEGSLGLWQGILHYTGGPIEEHCTWWISQYLARTVLLQALSGGMGQKLRQGMRDYVDVDNRLLTELGRNPTIEEIAEAMHVTAQDAAVYEDMLRSARSRQLVDNERQEQEIVPEDEQAVEDTAYFQSRQRILELLSCLSEQERTLLVLRYGLEGGMPLKPDEAGERLGLTAEEVVKLEAAALSKLRQGS